MVSGKPATSETETNCIVRSVASALAADPSLEAVTIDREQKKIAVATLGKVDEAKVADRITETVREAEGAVPETECTLLSSNPDCTARKIPLSAGERQFITISHQGATTTIARVTCPTAPKFWRWR